MACSSSKPQQEVKKTLIRNMEVSNSQRSSSRKTAVSTVKHCPEGSKKKTTVPLSCKSKTPSSHKVFDASDKSKSIKQSKSTPICSSASEKITSDEKLTRKVNFPFDQPIYRDLIPLTGSRQGVDDVISVTIRPSTTIQTQKDKEPDLNDFITLKNNRESYYLPDGNLSSFGNISRRIKKIDAPYNNLRLYQKIFVEKSS